MKRYCWSVVVQIMPTSSLLQCLDSRDVCKLGSATCSFSFFSVKPQEMWKFSQGVSKVGDKNEDKTVKSICDPKEPTR